MLKGRNYSITRQYAANLHKNETELAKDLEP
jgi:hypothetical protein